MITQKAKQMADAITAYYDAQAALKAAEAAFEKNPSIMSSLKILAANATLNSAKVTIDQAAHGIH